MEVFECDADRRTAWDDFVQAQSGAQYSHLFGWKRVIEDAYGHPCPYLVAVEGDAVRGVLPIAVVKSRIFGRSITSLPFLDTAGVLAPHADAREALVSRAWALANELEVDYLELRQTESLPGEFRVDSHKASLTRTLESTVEEMWDALPSERRNRVRKARKENLVVETGGPEALPRFYKVWSRNMRDLGSPAHSLKFFRQVLQNFGEAMNVLLVSDKQTDIGAAIVVTFKGMLSVPWVSSLRSHFALHPNDVLYWEAMKLAHSQGCRQFDFGRSTVDSGNYTYKVRWGARPSPILWHYRSVAGHPAALATADRRGYNLAVETWKRMPVALANWLGPRVRKSLTS
jgi:FemAB-related protein (PEP-CTERM system-associated)